MDSPHDKLFKVAFGDTQEAAPLLRSVLPAEVSAVIAWSTLEVVPGTFVDKALKERRTDILYEVRTKEGQLQLLYVLLEHQSSIDPMMAFRMYEYVAFILGRWRRKHLNERLLPRVIPVVLYAGEKTWDAPTAVETLFEAEPTDWTPRMSFILDDLSQVSDEALSGRAMGVFGEITLRALLKLPRSRDPAGELARWLPLLMAMLRDPNGLERLRHIIEYLAAVADLEPEALQPVVRQLGPAAEETAMTLAERLRVQGDHQGQAKVILRLLRLKFGELPEAITARVEAGTEADFERWTERVLVATTLDQVFDDAPGN